MNTGRQNKNLSWIDSSNEYDTQFNTPKEWDDMFSSIDLKPISKFLHSELSELGDHISIYPPKNLVFNAFKLTSPDNLKVVIL